MKIIAPIIFIWLFIWTYSSLYAQDPVIIPRASWWANSLYNSINSEYWKNILSEREASYAKYEWKQPTAAQLAAREKTKKVNAYLNENFSDQFDIQERVAMSPNTWTDLAWDLEYADIIDGIVIHHTDTEYPNSLDGMKNIHKFHSLSRQWWDIGYNYIIWYDGQIYEWREGGDYVVAAHSKYNNIWTVWIAIMGNYSHKWIDEKQYQALDSLVKYLTKKYGIDLSKKRYYHSDCAYEACKIFPIETYLDESLVWHRDTWHTSCPWDELYEQIQKIRTDNIEFTKWFTPVIRWESQSKNTDVEFQTPQIQKIIWILKKYSDEQIIAINTIIDQRLMTEQNENMRKTLQMIKTAGIIRLK